MDFTQRKKDLENNHVVKRPIERLDKAAIRKNGGRPRKMTPRRMLAGINKYFDWCEEHDEVPSIKGMMIHMKMFKDQFYSYLKYPEFTDMLEQARMIISNWAEMDVYNTKGMAAGKIAYMKNVHGWADKLEQTSMVTKVQLTPDEARKRIEALAPKLLEVLRTSEVSKQIIHEAEIVEK